ncbi:hypothetical protein [Enterovibrio norvegicus]|uniref:hypothetical protein n=1 Tax=Enterovibrio norvegicus TaxID=188144 RepID=UPI0018EA7979|nr:hypothetical protein [Enterovibrio norvegicus]
MKNAFYFPLTLLLASLFGCSVQGNDATKPNARILWANGVEEQVEVSSSNEHLVFRHASFTAQSLVIYSRIIGAGTPDCEYYVNEPQPAIRLTVCGDGNVELLNKGKVINIGKLMVFVS